MISRLLATDGIEWCFKKGRKLWRDVKVIKTPRRKKRQARINKSTFEMANAEEKLTKTPEQKTCAHTVGGRALLLWWWKITLGTLKRQAKKEEKFRIKRETIIPFRNYTTLFTRGRRGCSCDAEDMEWDYAFLWAQKKGFVGHTSGMWKTKYVLT